MRVHELIEALKVHPQDAEVGQVLFYRHFAKLEEIRDEMGRVVLWFDTVNCEEKA